MVSFSLLLPAGPGLPSAGGAGTGGRVCYRQVVLFGPRPRGPSRWGRGPLLSVGGPFWDRRRLAPAGWVPARSRAGARWGTAYPLGGRGFSEASGRSAPGGPPARRGPHFSREMGRKRAGGKPPGPPGFMARLLPLARFGVCATLSRSWGYFAAHLRTLIWRLSFIKCFFSIFFREMRPKSVLGFRRKQPLERIRDNNRQNERVPTSGPEPRGGGGPPPRLFASGLSLEKAWIPARDRAGNHLAGANLRWSKPGPPTRGSPVLRTLWGSASEAALGRSAPLPARPRAGARLSLEESRRKEHQGSALDPGFYGRSLPLAGFGDGCLWPVRGSISSGILRPIWDAFSRKICWKAFL